MVLIEVIAGLLLIGLVAAMVIGMVVLVPKLVARQIHKHSIEGKLARKQEALGEQLRLLEEIRQDIQIATDENRQLLLQSHYSIVEKNIELLEQDLRVLEEKREEERIEQSIERRRRQ